MKTFATLGCLFISLSAVLGFQSSAFQTSGVSINKFILFPDSSFFKQSNIAIAEGETFEVLNETKMYHEDDSQLQKFKWYHIKLRSGQTGWAFGNNVAIYDQKLNMQEKIHEPDQAKLSINFYNAKIWQASLQGFDANTSAKKPYLEKYLVFSNTSGKSRFIQIGREVIEGTSWAENVQFSDLNSDGFEEIVVELKSRGTMSETTNHYLEIFSMKHDAIQSIYSEKINLGRKSRNISPVNQKFFDVEEGNIRVAYLDYFDCSDSFGGTCMEYVTYSYAWDKSTNTFATLYEPSRTSPLVKPRSDKLNLLAAPGLYQTMGTVGTRETLKVIGQEEKIYKLGTSVEKKIFFLVQTAYGKKGYIESHHVQFIENDYSKALNSYYQHPRMNADKFEKDILAIQLEGSSL